MAEKLWWKKGWEEMNKVQLVEYVKNLSDNYFYGGWQPSGQEKKEYKAAYERAQELGYDPWTISGCVRPGAIEVVGK